jgi:hypothetical protein
MRAGLVVLVAALACAACGKEKKKVPSEPDAAPSHREQSIFFARHQGETVISVNGVKVDAAAWYVNVDPGVTHVTASTNGVKYEVDVNVGRYESWYVPLTPKQCFVHIVGCEPQCGFVPLRVLEKQTVAAPMRHTYAREWDDRFNSVACKLVPTTPDLYLADCIRNGKGGGDDDEAIIGGRSYRHASDAPGRANDDKSLSIGLDEAAYLDKYRGFLEDAVRVPATGFVYGASVAVFWVKGDKAAVVDVNDIWTSRDGASKRDAGWDGTFELPGEGIRWIANSQGAHVRAILARGVAGHSQRDNTFGSGDLRLTAVEASYVSHDFRGLAREDGQTLLFFYHFGRYPLSTTLKTELEKAGFDFAGRIAARDKAEAAAVDACLAKLASAPSVSCGTSTTDELSSARLHRLVHAPPETPVFARLRAERDINKPPRYELTLYRAPPPHQTRETFNRDDLFRYTVRIAKDGVTPVALAE